LHDRERGGDASLLPRGARARAVRRAELRAPTAERRLPALQPRSVVGPVHTCFLAAAGDYDRWKDDLTAKGVEIVEEIKWERGPRSFYFEDPAGNMLEIAEGDMWPA
jgi:catechol 2,3-dioxygenase-like lactoylglutathione lyase family enzyme